MITHGGQKFSKNSTKIHERMSRALPGQWVGKPVVEIERPYTSCVSYCNKIYREYWCLDTLVSSIYRPTGSNVAEIKIFNPNRNLDPTARRMQMLIGRAAAPFYLLRRYDVSVSKTGVGVTVNVCGEKLKFERSITLHATQMLDHGEYGRGTLLPYAIIDDKLVELPSLPVSRVRRRQRVVEVAHNETMYARGPRMLMMSALTAGLPLQYDRQRRIFFAPWSEAQIEKLGRWQPGDPLPSREDGPLAQLDLLEIRQRESRQEFGTRPRLAGLDARVYPEGYYQDYVA